MRNVDECLSPSYVEPHQIRQLTALTKLDMFKGWLSPDPNASSLLIHGNSDQADVHTPLSYLCARLAREYEDVKCFVVLTYFCGLRRDEWDLRANAAGIMSEMVGQLLSDPRLALCFDLGFINRRYLEKIESNDLVSLCKLFLELIHQLRHKKFIIFCLIDSISMYETSDRRADTETLLSTLHNIVDGQRGTRRKKKTGLVFKLLVTDWSSSKYAYRIFENNEILNMSEDIDEGEEDNLEI